MSALSEITRENVLRALHEAKERFVLADAALKIFRFSYPARPEEFDEWKRLGDVWDKCDEKVQVASADLRDFDHGMLTASGG